MADFFLFRLWILSAGKGFFTMIIRDMTLDDKEIFLKMSADFYTSDAALHDFDRETQEKNLAGAIAGSP